MLFLLLSDLEVVFIKRFFFQAEDGIRARIVTGVQTCALPIWDLSIKSALERDVRLVRFEDGTLEIALEAGARKTLIGELSKKLGDWTGRRWMVAVSAEAGRSEEARVGKGRGGGAWA